MIRWITPSLATGPFEGSRGEPGPTAVVDVRELVDKAGNLDGPVGQLVERAASLLAAGERVLICCDYGMSRSNAVAAGALARHQGLRLDEATARVLEATGERAIKLEVLDAVRRALGEGEAERGPTWGRVLLTGGGGFLGQAAAAALRGRGVSVLAPSRAEVDLVQGPTQLDLLARRHGADAVLHLASPRVYTSNAAMGETLSMLRNVVDVCAANRAPLVFLSSWEIYSGYRAELLLASEPTPPLPKGPYGETKMLCERLLRHHVDVNGLDLSLLRFGPIYGSSGDRPRFLRTFLAKARAGEEIVTHQYDNGPPRLDLLAIDDAVSALLAVVERRAPGEFNLGGGACPSTRDVAAALVDLVGSKSSIKSARVGGYTPNILLDTSRARRLLGWSPAVDLSQGLARFIREV